MFDSPVGSGILVSRPEYYIPTGEVVVSTTVIQSRGVKITIRSDNRSQVTLAPNGIRITAGVSPVTAPGTVKAPVETPFQLQQVA